MKILVIEDKAQHQESARATLQGHDVTILTSFEEAVEALEETVDRKKVQQGMQDAGFAQLPEDKELRQKYWDLKDQLMNQAIAPFPYDVVLTDMMMPMSGLTLAPGYFKPSEQVPYGYVIALRAALRGAKYVAMVTDTNHHHGAMSAALDQLSSGYYTEGFKPNFLINGAKCMFVHAPFTDDQSKNWGQVLKDLIAE